MTQSQRPDAWFTVRCQASGDTLEVFVEGELDLASRGRLPAVAEWRDQHFASVVIDMVQLEFIDAAGLADIVAMSDAAAAEGLQLTVRGARPHIRRVFEITELTGLLENE